MIARSTIAWPLNLRCAIVTWRSTSMNVGGLCPSCSLLLTKRFIDSVNWLTYSLMVTSLTTPHIAARPNSDTLSSSIKISKSHGMANAWNIREAYSRLLVFEMQSWTHCWYKPNRYAYNRPNVACNNCYHRTVVACHNLSKCSQILNCRVSQ